MVDGVQAALRLIRMRTEKSPESAEEAAVSIEEDSLSAMFEVESGL